MQFEIMESETIESIKIVLKMPQKFALTFQHNISNIFIFNLTCLSYNMGHVALYTAQHIDLNVLLRFTETT